MAWHSRYIDNSRNKRINITFRRTELLYQGRNVTNPYTGIKYNLPVFSHSNKLNEKFYIGPNILDLIKKVLLSQEELEELNLPSTAEPYIWRIRDSDDFFARPKLEPNQDEKSAKSKNAKKEKDLGPFNPSLCTGGKLIEKGKQFTVVTKESSVSISAQIFLLTTAISRKNSLEASALIQELATKAWDKDLERAELLYQAIKANGGEMMDYDIPPNLKATSAVSQEVEHKLYCRVCRWLDIDPKAPVLRKRGRPKKSDNPTVARGEYIELRLFAGETNGRTISAIAGFAPDTDLARLSLIELVSILNQLQELEANEDCTLLVAFLDLIDPDWRVNVLDSEPNVQPLDDRRC